MNGLQVVFGDYISIYDIQRAVADKATVPIYYDRDESELPKIDEEFDEITEGEEQTKKEKLKSKWAALVGDPKRVVLIAAHLVAHFEKRGGDRFSSTAQASSRRLRQEPASVVGFGQFRWNSTSPILDQLLLVTQIFKFSVIINCGK